VFHDIEGSFEDRVRIGSQPLWARNGPTAEKRNAVDDNRRFAFRVYIHAQNDGIPVRAQHHPGLAAARTTVPARRARGAARERRSDFSGSIGKNADRANRIHIITRADLETGKILSGAAGLVKGDATQPTKFLKVTLGQRRLRRGPENDTKGAYEKECAKPIGPRF
jgi:hypothetical protein